MTGRLEEAIRRFRKLPAAKEWKTRDGAAQQCYEASYRFVNFLKGRGIAAEVVELILDETQIRQLARRGHTYPAIFDGFHYVVTAEGHLIDWTARQYKAKAPYPVAISIDDFEINWKERRDEIAFPRLTKR